MARRLGMVAMELVEDVPEERHHNPAATEQRQGDASKQDARQGDLAALGVAGRHGQLSDPEQQAGEGDDGQDRGHRLGDVLGPTGRWGPGRRTTP